MRPSQKDKSSMLALDSSNYQTIVTWLEDQESRRTAVPVAAIRPKLAREIGVSPGTLENIRKGRFKALQGRVERAIDAALVRMLKRQHERIERELEIANARLEQGPASLVAKAEAARDALAALIERQTKP